MQYNAQSEILCQIYLTFLPAFATLIVMMINRVKLGGLVAQERDKQSMSQIDLAKRVEASRTSISNIENGKQALSLDLFCRIADALNIRPDVLLRGSLDKQIEIYISSDEVTDPLAYNLIVETIK